MKTNYLIVYGAYGYPEENWFPWLKAELGNENIFVPRFPTPEGQTFDIWLAMAEEALKNCMPENTVLIGHSTGAILVLRMAERARTPYKAIFAACPFARGLNLKFDHLNQTFINPPFDWSAVKRGAKTITCYAGDNDPYVPLDYSKEVADAVDAPLIVVPNGGHLNANAGMLTFPLLYEHIKKLTANSK